MSIADAVYGFSLRDDFPRILYDRATASLMLNWKRLHFFIFFFYLVFFPHPAQEAQRGAAGSRATLSCLVESWELRCIMPGREDVFYYYHYWEHPE